MFKDLNRAIPPLVAIGIIVAAGVGVGSGILLIAIVTLL